MEVPRLRLAGAGPTTLGWDPQAATAGPATTYTVVSGDAGELRTDGGFAGACTLDAALTSPASADSRPDPPVGTIYYYLARAGNDCDAGTYGNGSGS